MARRVGITGGIGSGKSVVSKALRAMGYKVYDADSNSKRLCVNTTKRTALLRAMRAYTRTARYGCEYQVDLAAVEACLDGSFIMHYNENVMG